MKNKKLLFGIIGLLFVVFIGFFVMFPKEGPMPDAEHLQQETKITFNNNESNLSFKTEQIVPSTTYKDVEPKIFTIKNETDRTQIFSISATNVRPVNENEIPFDEFFVNVLILDKEDNAVFEGTLAELNSMQEGEMQEFIAYCKLINKEPDCSQIINDVTGLKENVDYVTVKSFGFERVFKPGNTIPQKIKANKSLEYKMYIWFSEEMTDRDLLVGTYNPETGEKGTAKASLDFDLTVYQIDAELFDDVNKKAYAEKWDELVEEKVVSFKNTK